MRTAVKITPLIVYSWDDPPVSGVRFATVWLAVYEVVLIVRSVRLSTVQPWSNEIPESQELCCCFCVSAGCLTKFRTK